MANGEIVTVKNIRASGEIELADGRTLPASYRQFVRGYAVTSDGSQGKTVDHVLFGDAAVVDQELRIVGIVRHEDLQAIKED